MNYRLHENLIGSSTELATVCERARTAGVVGLDTEFERSRTWSAQLALLQIGVEDEAWLFDPLQITDWSALAGLLEDTGVVKVLHSCEEDLEVLFQATGVWPEALYDTQVAAAFAGLEVSLGYSRLVAELLDIEIPKTSQRSNWLARPLSAEQSRYAALDAVCLPDLYRLLQDKVAARGLQRYCSEDCQMVVDNARARLEEGYDFRRVKGSGDLDAAGLAVLQSLCAWREERARVSDKPRSWVLSDALLVDLARGRPDSLAALAELEGMPASVVRKQGDVLLQRIEAALAVAPEQWPRAAQGMPPRLQRRWLKALQQEVRVVAERVDLAPSVLAGNRDLGRLLASGFPQGPWRFPPKFDGWRGELLKPALEDCLTRLVQETAEA